MKNWKDKKIIINISFIEDRNIINHITVQTNQDKRKKKHKTYQTDYKRGKHTNLELI